MPLMMADGSWSFMPMQEVSNRPIVSVGGRLAEAASGLLLEGRGHGRPAFHMGRDRVVEIDGVFSPGEREKK